MATTTEKWPGLYMSSRVFPVTSTSRPWARNGSSRRVGTTLANVALVIEMTGSRSRVVHRPRPQDDPRQRRPDISKADDVLGWAPQTELRDGLKRTIAYFEGLLSDEAIRPHILDELGAKA